MRLAIVRGGGLAGIPTTTRLRTDAMPDAEAKELEAKVRSSSLLSGPEPAGTGPPHPDGLLYELTVDDGEAERTHRFSDADLPDDVRALIEWVDARPERDFKPGS